MSNGTGSPYAGMPVSVLPEIGQYSAPVPAPGQPTNIPTKVASFAGPYRVLNLSYQVTYWLADNPNVRDGNGMRLAPGTSLIWTGSRQTQELWCIQGTDASSVAATDNEAITIGAPAQDVQPDPIAIATQLINSGVILVEKETTIFPAQLNGTAVGGSGFLDVSTKQSIYVRMLYVAGSGNIQFLWFDSTQTIALGEDNYGWVAGDNVPCTLHIPCVGAFLQINWNWSQTNGFNLLVIGSQRTVPALHQRLSTRELGGVTASIGSTVLQTLDPIFRYDGKVHITAAVGATAVPNEGLEVSVTDRVTTDVIHRAMVNVIALTGHTFAVHSDFFIAPRNSWRVNITNRATTTQTITCAITAAPEGA